MIEKVPDSDFPACEHTGTQQSEARGETVNLESGLDRGFRARHVSMIAISGGESFTYDFFTLKFFTYNDLANQQSVQGSSSDPVQLWRMVDPQACSYRTLLLEPWSTF